MNDIIDLSDRLIDAARDGDFDAVCDLLSKGADPKYKDSKDQTPFNQALAQGIFYQCINLCCWGTWSNHVRQYRAIIELLLSQGATLDAIEKYAKLPSPEMQKMIKDYELLSKHYVMLITDIELACRILPRLPQTLTWI